MFPNFIFSQITPTTGNIWIDNTQVEVPIEQNNNIFYLTTKIVSNYNLSVIPTTIAPNPEDCPTDRICASSFDENICRGVVSLCEGFCPAPSPYTLFNSFSSALAVSNGIYSLPIVSSNDSNFPNDDCYKRMYEIYLHSLNAVKYFHDSFDDYPNKHYFAVYNGQSSWTNTFADNDGITMYQSAADYPDATYHEWVHTFTRSKTNEVIRQGTGVSGVEVVSLDEGLGDIWGSLIEAYIENPQLYLQGNATPDYYQGLVGRDFGNNYKAYRSCEIVRTSGNISALTWNQQSGAGLIEHRRGMAIGHWFYLLAEGTGGAIKSVTFRTPNSTDPTNFSCTNLIEKTVTFDISGIGYLDAEAIIHGALQVFGDGTLQPPMVYPTFREGTILAAKNLYGSDETIYCDILQNLTESWYAINVGDRIVDIETNAPVCVGNPLTINAFSSIGEDMKLLLPDGSVVGATASSDGLSIDFEKTETTEADGNQAYTLQVLIKTIDGIDVTDDGTGIWCDYPIVPKVKYIVAEEVRVCETENQLILKANIHPSANISEVIWKDYNGNTLATLSYPDCEELSNDNCLLIYTINNNTPPTNENPYVYQVTAKFNTTQGNEVEVTENIKVYVDAPAMINPNNNAQDVVVCNEEVVNIKASEYIHADSYELFFDGEQQGMGQDVEIPFMVTPEWVGSTHSITIEGTNETCSNTVSVSFNITFGEIPNFNFSAEPNSIACGGVKLSTNLSNPENYEFEWSGGSNPMSIETIFTTETEVLNETVSLTITEPISGCTQTQTINITLYPLPEEPIITFGASGNCSLVLEAPTFNGVTYQWYFNGEAITDIPDALLPSYTATMIGEYSVEVKNQYECKESDVVNVLFEDLVTTESASNLNTIISNNSITTWTTDRHIEGLIVVPADKTLIIDDASISFVGETSGIDVRIGGILKLDNGAVLKASDCSETAWRGITGTGIDGAPQPPPSSYLNNGSPNHSVIIVQNGSKIQDAFTGIHAVAALDVQPPASGAIIYAVGSVFENNRISIQINRYVGTPSNTSINIPPNPQRSVIVDNQFYTTKPFRKSGSTIAQNYGEEYLSHIFLNQAGSVNIYGNEFNVLASNNILSGENKGAGIRAINTRISIGTDVFEFQEDQSYVPPTPEITPNVFKDLYCGIDVFNTLNIAMVTDIVSNVFVDVERSIVLNTAHFSKIQDNTITVPYINHNTPSYGIFARQSHNLIIQDNELIMNIDVTGPNQTRGLVLQDCFAPLAASGINANDDAEQSDIINNVFRGDFGAASQMEGDDQAIRFQCNHYVGLENNGSQVAERDWFLPVISLDDGTALSGLGLPTLLGIFDEGLSEMVVNDCPILPLSQQWHDDSIIGDEGVHIENNAVAHILLNIDATNSAPSLISGTGGTTSNNDCGKPDGSPCATSITVANNGGNNGGVTTYPHYPPIDPRPVNTSLPCQVNVELIHYWLTHHQMQDAINALECLGQVWTDKLLVGTYTAQGNTALAQQTLARIPQNTPTNIEFHQLFNAVHQEQISPIEHIAQQRYSVNSGIAQSILAEWRGDVYTRKAMPIPTQSSKTRSNREASTTIGFQLYPNPSHQFVKVAFEGKEEVRTLKIFNLEGQEIDRHKILPNQSIDVHQLKVGMYYVQLEGFTTLSKLLIIH